MIGCASSWLGSNGILTDFHKNTLVVGVKLESKMIKSVDFYVKDLPIESGKFGGILVELHMSRWFLIFGNKKKLAESLYRKCREFLPTYEFLIKFSI
jgi:hypothetical protein